MRSALQVSLVALWLAACEPFTPDPDAGFDPDAGPGVTGCKSIDAVRSLSQSCCPEYGIDACGAGLFCAAFDGRTIATCYPLYSRRDMESCRADNQCSGGSCNLTTGLCRSGGGVACTTATGCRGSYTCKSGCPGYTSCVATCSVACTLLCL